MLSHKPTTTQSAVQETLHFLKIKKSPIHGKGLFSEVNLEAGTVVCELKGEKVGHEYGAYMATQNPNWLGIGYEEWLKLQPRTEGLYINHSCNPNVIVNERLQVITIAPLKADEELFLDYSTTELDPFWQMDCSCGQHNCRRILKAYQFLPYELKTKYNLHLAPVFAVLGEEVYVHNMQLR